MATNTSTNDGTGDSSTTNKVRDAVAPILGILILIGFAAFIYFMLGQTGAAEPVWSRNVYLFAAVEAIAFTAVGYFFGKEVHRQAAENAEERASNNETDAANGRALAELVQAKAQTNEAIEESVPGSGARQSDLQELAGVARSLFRGR